MERPAPMPAAASAAAPARIARTGAAAGAGFSARYAVCAMVLSASAVGVWVAPPLLGLYLRKEAIPLKRALAQFDVRPMGPRYERHPATDQMGSLSADMVESLGTPEYLQILISDTQAPAGSDARIAKVFLTYYTGQPDMVPHVPDECYLAGGFSPLSTETIRVKASGAGAANDEIPVRVVEFRAPASRRSSGGGETTTVMYFFHVNGGFATTRDGVRRVLTDPTLRYAYYAKIEVSFLGANLARNANKDESLAALGPLLERLMPVLYEQHFDLETLRLGRDARN